MKSLLISVFYNFCMDIILAINSTCGIDSSPVTVVYEGIASVDTYPWMGYLYYISDNTRYTTTAVLVTKQIVIAGASEIDRLPKDDFRAVTRVVMGNPCGQNEIRVRDYTFHPEYETNTYSALAIIQLDIDNVKQELRPICPPPAHFANPKFYAMTMVKGCKNPKIRIHTMEYVDINKCKHFYRKSGLDQKNFWPTHMACARAVSGGKCVWHSGSVLTIKQGGRWRMLGFSINGPGCGDPSRFLDYGKYHKWIQRSVSSFGHPAISRLRDNYVVMRRSLSNVQRFGPCDLEEVKFELYSDKVTIIYRPGQFNGKYNLTLIAGIEYSCIIFQAKPLEKEDY